MANLISVVKKLKMGQELCARCGRDITGTLDCVHPRKYMEVNTQDKVTLEVRAPDGQLIEITRTPGGTRVLGTLDYNMRIGMEMLMDLEYLSSLPLCDPDSSVRRGNLSFLMRVASNQITLMSIIKKEV